jgi:cyclic-di-GMP-binding protein
VLEEKLVKRKVSLKVLDYGKVEEASGGTARQEVKLVAGISSDKARELNKFIKGLGLKGVQSQTQGEQLRVTSKKRDDLQQVINALKEEDFGIPLQYQNFRD